MQTLLSCLVAVVAVTQVGASTALVLRGVRQLAGGTTVRLGLRLSPRGLECDLGSSKRFSELATSGCTVSVGLQVRVCACACLGAPGGLSREGRGTGSPAEVLPYTPPVPTSSPPSC